jgi:hypothetical protein
LQVNEDYATFREWDRAWMAAQKKEWDLFALIDQNGIDDFTDLIEQQEIKN